ncbi:MAG: hypothetical protein EOP04_09125, partial [Proteobacteria bacterium]
MIGINAYSDGIAIGSAVVSNSKHVWLGHPSHKAFIQTSLLINYSPFYSGEIDVKFDNNDSYIGSVSYGMKNGFGTYFYKSPGNERSYQGDWLNDVKEGQGTTTWDPCCQKSWKSFSGFF